MTVFDVDIDALTGGSARLNQYRGSALLVEVNGPGRHPLHAELVGDGPDIQWNFEKFLATPDGQVARRFEPGVPPDDPELVAAVEKLLPR
jgi:glutathione peroxidase-family protein